MMAAGFVGRVGGLAAVLGAGVVIGLAASAPASADATDSPMTETTESSAQTGSVSGSHSVASPLRRTITARTDRAATVRPAAGAAARSARAAAAVSAPKAELAAKRHVSPAAAVASPTPAAPSAAAPALAAATGPSAVVATAVGPTASATAAASTTPVAAATQSLASLLGCDPRGQKITVFKGTHVAIPLNLGFFTRKVTGSATFTPDTAYDLGDVDQYDWNKLTGIAFSPLQHDRNSAMVGWRYNLTTQEFEIAPFYNVDKKRILPNEQTEVISVPADQPFTYTVDYTGITISYGDTTVYKPYPQGLTANPWLASRVSGWFGGNEVAPKKVSYYLKLNRMP